MFGRLARSASAAVKQSSMSDVECLRVGGWQSLVSLGSWWSSDARTAGIHTSPVPQHGSKEVDPNAPSIQVTFVERDGQERQVRAPMGQSLLEVAHSNDIDLEGACEGSLACSTCHVIVEDQAYYDKLDEPDDDENDMLDLAFGLTETSRLGCQIKACKELDHLKVKIPSASRNIGKEVA
ncbi:hypothetical protein BSKO_00153 [Bryopsis sp. KO-2023]|nr:hypothetical protein BSKO_00153 [Bryopsis sp. KO-2023]